MYRSSRIGTLWTFGAFYSVLSEEPVYAVSVDSRSKLSYCTVTQNTSVRNYLFSDNTGILQRGYVGCVDIAKYYYPVLQAL